MSPNAMVNQIEGLNNQNFNNEGISSVIGDGGNSSTISSGSQGSQGNTMTVQQNTNSFSPFRGENIPKY